MRVLDGFRVTEVDGGHCLGLSSCLSRACGGGGVGMDGWGSHGRGVVADLLVKRIMCAIGLFWRRWCPLWMKFSGCFYWRRRRFCWKGDSELFI